MYIYLILEGCANLNKTLHIIKHTAIINIYTVCFSKTFITALLIFIYILFISCYVLYLRLCHVYCTRSPKFVSRMEFCSSHC